MAVVATGDGAGVGVVEVHMAGGAVEADRPVGAGAVEGVR